MEHHFVVLMVAEDQPTLVSQLCKDNEDGYRQELELGLRKNGHFVVEEDLEDGKDVRRQ